MTPGSKKSEYTKSIVGNPLLKLLLFVAAANCYVYTVSQFKLTFNTNIKDKVRSGPNARKSFWLLTENISQNFFLD